MQYDRSMTHYQHEDDHAGMRFSRRDNGRYSPRRYEEKQADYYYESSSARDLHHYSESDSYRREESRMSNGSSRSLRGLPRNEPRFGGSRSCHNSRPARGYPREPLPPSTRYDGYGSRSSHHRRTHTDPSLAHPPSYPHRSNCSLRNEDQSELEQSFHDEQQPATCSPRQDREHSYYHEDHQKEYSPYHQEDEQPQRISRIDRGSFRRSLTMDSSSGYQQRGGPRRHVSTDGLCYSEPHHPHPYDSYRARSTRRDEDDHCRRSYNDPRFRRSLSLRPHHEPPMEHNQRQEQPRSFGRGSDRLSSSRRTPNRGYDEEHHPEQGYMSSNRGKAPLSSDQRSRSEGYDTYDIGTLEAEQDNLQRRFDRLSMSSSQQSHATGYDANTDPAMDASQQQSYQRRRNRLSPTRRSPTSGDDAKLYADMDIVDKRPAHSDFQQRRDGLSSPRRSPTSGNETALNGTNSVLGKPLEQQIPEQEQRRRNPHQRSRDRSSRRSLSMGYGAVFRTSKNKQPLVEQSNQRRSDRLAMSLSLSPLRTPPHCSTASKKSISPSNSSVSSSLEKKRRKRKEKLMRDWGSTKDVPVQYLKRPPIDYSKLGGEDDTPLPQEEDSPEPPLPREPPAETPLMDDASGVLSEASFMDGSGVLSEASFMDVSDVRSLLGASSLTSGGLLDMDPSEVVRRANLPPPPLPIPPPPNNDVRLDNRTSPASTSKNTCPEEALDLRWANKWKQQQGMGQHGSAGEAYIEILPGVLDHLRRIRETKRAIQADRVVPIRCVSCETDLMCMDNLKYVLCPHCEVVSPALEGSCSEQGRVQSMSGPRRHGTAVGLTYPTFYKVQADILLR